MPGQEIENIIVHAVVQMLRDGDALTTALHNTGIAAYKIPAILAAAKKIEIDTPDLIEQFVQRAELRQDGISVNIKLTSLLPSEKITVPIITRDILMQMKRRGVEMRLVLDGDSIPPRTDATLINAIARAHHWFQQLASGQANNIAEIATRENVDRSYAARILNLAFLAPDIVARITAGQQPADLSIEKLTKRTDLPIDWSQQRQMLGCA